MRSVVGETVTAILRSYPGTTYARSSSDLAQSWGLSSQTCHCLDVRIFRSGAGPLGGDCFPRLAAMYLAEAKPPVVWRPAFEVIAGRTMYERTDLERKKVTVWCKQMLTVYFCFYCK